MSVNIYTSDWRKTGAKVEVPQFEMKIRVQKGDRDIVRTVQFPDILFDLPAEYAKEKMTELLTDYVIKKVGE